MTAIATAIPDGLYAHLQELARKEQISLDELVRQAVQDLVARYLEREHILERASIGTREGFLEFMAQVPDREPNEDDRL